MKNEFVPYEEALAIYQLDKKVDFGEDFGYWHQYNNKWFIETPHSYDYGTHKNIIPAPLYQQAFRWLSPRTGLRLDKPWRLIKEYMSIDGMSIEEAELACLRKLIEIVNQNKDE